MIAKLTSKNQITIPKKIMSQLPETQYFDVKLKDGVVVMRPLVVYDIDLESIRSKIKSLGLEAGSVREAVRWAREKQSAW